MAHDPLCLVGVRPWEDNYCCQRCNPGEIPPWERTCQCVLIAKVRADERNRIFTHLDALADRDHTEGCPSLTCTGCAAQ